MDIETGDIIELLDSRLIRVLSVPYRVQTNTNDVEFEFIDREGVTVIPLDELEYSVNHGGKNSVSFNFSAIKSIHTRLNKLGIQS